MSRIRVTAAIILSQPIARFGLEHELRGVELVYFFFSSRDAPVLALDVTGSRDVQDNLRCIFIGMIGRNERRKTLKLSYIPFKIVIVVMVRAAAPSVRPKGCIDKYSYREHHIPPQLYGLHFHSSHRRFPV